MAKTATRRRADSNRERTPSAKSNCIRSSLFRNAGDWLVRAPEVSALFYEQRGSLADSFGFLSQIDGTEERLFPGYGKFESSLDGRVMSERLPLRQKMRALERYVAEGAERLVTATSPERLTTMGADTVAINAAFS